MQLKDVITRIRTNTHDKDLLEYDDDTILDYINDGIRFVRRTVIAIDPLQLTEILEGTIEAGTDVIKPENKLSSVLEVRVNGKKLRLVNPLHISDNSQQGEPEYYYISGFGDINVYPAANADMSYKALAISDMQILKDVEDDFPLMNDLLDFVVEYACIRASMTNEFDLSQETAVMGSVISQIETLIRKYNNQGLQTAGYWNPSNHSHNDYHGRRYR